MARPSSFNRDEAVLIAMEEIWSNGYTETGITVDLPVNLALALGLAILVHFVSVLHFQPFTRLVQHIVQPLANIDHHE